MDQVREVCSAGSALRKGAGLRNRLPLAELTIVVSGAGELAGFEPIVADELNVKSVRLLDDQHPDAASYGVSRRLTVNARAAGPRLGKDVQTAIKASKSGDWSVADDGTVTAGGLVLQEGEYTLDTVAGGGDDSATGMLPRGGFVVLDTALTPELEAEGVARDLVRAVQQARRDAGLEVSDRIVLTIAARAEVADAARAHQDLIAAETLATSVAVEVSDVEHPVIELRASMSDLDLDRRRHHHAARAAGEHRVGEQERAADRRRGRGRAAAAGAPRRCRGTATPSSRGPRSGCPSGS